MTTPKISRKRIIALVSDGLFTSIRTYVASDGHVQREVHAFFWAFESSVFAPTLTHHEAGYVTALVNAELALHAYVGKDTILAHITRRLENAGIIANLLRKPRYTQNRLF